MNSISDFKFTETDALLSDLEGWSKVLDTLSDSRDDVPPVAILMVAQAMKRCVSDLREATGTAPQKRVPL